MQDIEKYKKLESSFKSLGKSPIDYNKLPKVIPLSRSVIIDDKRVQFFNDLIERARDERQSIAIKFEHLSGRK